ncbi:MAG: sigma-70 family RNA polymerase sigma factor [Actinomycetota bacterium]|nr:sigma-70 family RNA polymerase sigma factor [Actinomycetota bacterium]
MDEPDPQVVAAAKAGNVGAFEELVRAYQAPVWRLVVTLVHDRSAADDATQEAFVRAFRFLHRYRGDSKFTTWLMTVARNSAVDELRRTRRAKRVTDRAVSQPPAQRSDHSVGIEVREALKALPQQLREPIVLIDMFGMSYGETARILAIPEGTVKSRVHKGRIALASSLGDDLLGETNSGS